MKRIALTLAALGLSGTPIIVSAQQQPAAGQTQVSAGQVAPAPTAQMSSSLGVYVFPSKNQTSDQQRHDESDCYAWAKQQTGIDPIAGAPAPTPATTQAPPAGGAVRGAAHGAAAGALIGAAAGNAGEGAAVGAAAGGVGGRAKQRAGAAQAQQQAQANAQQTTATNKSTFNRAFSACLEPKGYTIK